jgi:hypothetical protein
VGFEEENFLGGVLFAVLTLGPTSFPWMGGVGGCGGCGVGGVGGLGVGGGGRKIKLSSSFLELAFVYFSEWHFRL